MGMGYWVGTLGMGCMGMGYWVSCTWVWGTWYGGMVYVGIGYWVGAFAWEWGTWVLGTGSRVLGIGYMYWGTCTLGL